VLLSRRERAGKRPHVVAYLRYINVAIFVKFVELRCSRSRRLRARSQSFQFSPSYPWDRIELNHQPRRRARAQHVPADKRRRSIASLPICARRSTGRWKLIRVARDHCPKIRLLSEKHLVRQGFIEPAQFERLRAALPDNLRDPVSFLYLTSWRCGAMRTLQWRDIELSESGGRILLRAENSKTCRAQALPLAGNLLALIQGAAAKRKIDCPFVFHRDGKQIRDFRKAWTTACTAIGMPNLLIHDLRRSGIRNLVRAGVPEVVAMAISGHRTRSIFDRYNIASESDLAAAMASIASYHREHAEMPAKVIALRRAQSLQDGRENYRNARSEHENREPPR
jgi:integrase